MNRKSSCDECIHYTYDDEYECYLCQVNLDEDEMSMFLRNAFGNCPYFRLGDDYTIVKKQL